MLRSLSSDNNTSPSLLHFDLALEVRPSCEEKETKVAKKKSYVKKHIYNAYASYSIDR